MGDPGPSERRPYGPGLGGAGTGPLEGENRLSGALGRAGPLGEPYVRGRSNEDDQGGQEPDRGALRRRFPPRAGLRAAPAQSRRGAPEAEDPLSLGLLRGPLRLGPARDRRLLSDHGPRPRLGPQPPAPDSLARRRALRADRRWRPLGEARGRRSGASQEISPDTGGRPAAARRGQRRRELQRQAARTHRPPGYDDDVHAGCDQRGTGGGLARELRRRRGATAAALSLSQSGPRRLAA